MTTKEVFTSYFDLLKETLAKHELMDKPAQIYNCDESGMPLQHKMPKTIAQRGTKKVRQRSSGNKTQISVLACGNAVGQVIPPMVIFAGKTSIMSSQMGKFQEHFMGCLTQGGWTKSCFPNGFLHIFSNMLFLVDLYCYSLTAILPTLLWSWFKQLQKKTSSFSAYLRTPLPIVNPWIHLSSDL